MKVKNVFKNFFYLEEDDNEYNEASSPKPQPAQPEPKKPKKQQKTVSASMQQEAVKERQQMATPLKSKNSVPRKKNMPAPVIESDYAQVNNVVSFTQKTSKVILFEPFSYSEAQDIGDCLKNKKAAVVNLQRIDRTQGKRIIDFLSGAIFALNGDIKQIGTDIFLCTPDNVEVDGTISTNYFED